MDLCLIAVNSILAILGPVGSFLIALFGLGIVIFVHELGHFLVAKACGVKCEKFYVGFDVPISLGPFRLPSALVRKQWGETEYGIGIIPLGGYVKMLGQDDNPAHAAKEAERIRLEGGESGETTLDPRSYPAKSVPQRMAIISAGVIMNIIFAVIFASIAFRMGVKYIPASISSAVPGSPSWEAGMLPGDKILQIGKEGSPDEQLTFDRDLAFSTLKTNATSSLDMLIRRQDGSERWISLQPRRLSNEKGETPKIGGGVPFGDQVFVSPLPTASVANAGLQSGDRIVKVELAGTDVSFESPYQILRELRQHADEPAQLTIARPLNPGRGAANDGPTTELEATLAPQPLRETGLRMRIGPVAGVQRGSPAEAAGFQEGDIVVKIADEPVQDAVLLDSQFAPYYGQPVKVTIARPGADDATSEVELTVTPNQHLFDSEPALPSRFAAADSIGLAYSVTDIVDRVLPGSAAEEAGIQPGDRLTDVKFAPAPGSKITPAELRSAGFANVELEVDRDEWTALFWGRIQDSPEDLAIEFVFDSSGIIRKFTLAEYTPMNEFLGSRGLQFDVLTRVRTATNWGEAVRLGVRETRSGVEQVIFILRNIGSLYRNIGGPVAIASLGTQEASAGLSRLLIFLTMLSANLAVLNFLPIPVLDGGHMLFLLYEGLVGKPVNERVAMGLTMLGLCFILTLMLIVFGWDLYRLPWWS